MRRALLLLLLLAAGLCLPTAVAAGPEETQDPDVHQAFNDLYPVAFRVQVNEAIERGKAWLLSAQQADGSWSTFAHHRRYPMGSTALAVLTLLKCGVPPDHASLTRAFAYLQTLPLVSVYSVSVLLMALDAKYAPARDPFEVETVDRYGNRGAKDPCANKITPADKAWMEKGVAFLLKAQTVDGVWRYPSGGFDTSNTQFALLGLHAATRCGVTISQSVWLDALRYMLAFQAKEGEPVLYEANEVRGRYRFEWTERAIARGFQYVPGTAAPYASMTSAGLTCLIICQSRLWRARAFTGQLRSDTRRGIRDAIAWLQTHFAVDHNPGGSDHWTYYHLYGLERAGVLGRFRFLGTHDWYREGAEFLFSRQTPRGSWSRGSHGEGSCFALLFLKRATTRMDAPVLTPSSAKDGEMPSTNQGARPAKPSPETPETQRALTLAVARAIRDLDDADPDTVFLAARRLGELGHLRATAPLLHLLKRHKDDDARVAAASALGTLGAVDAVPGLIQALDDRDTLVQHAAERALLRITGYTPETRLRTAQTRNDRIRLQRAWRSWWSQNEDALRQRRKQPDVR